MGFADGLSAQERGRERSGERIARPHSVGYFHMGCLYERRMVGGEHITAVGAAGENENSQMVGCQ